MLQAGTRPQHHHDLEVCCPCRQHDLHLLDQQEQSILHNMQALPAAARSLLLRLLLRKRRWYALASLTYSEVPDVEAAAAQLRGSGLVCCSADDGVDLDSLLPELPVVVLKAVLAKVLPRSHPAVVANAAGTDKAALVNSIKVSRRRDIDMSSWLTYFMMYKITHPGSTGVRHRQ